MSTVFKLKRSSVKGKAPTTSNIELGEIAINTNDGRLFFKTTDSASSSAIVTLREISAGTGMTQTGGELKISDTGVVTGSYGSATEIPILSINAQGQIDSATTVSVAGVSGLAYDSGSNLLTLSTADGGSYSVKIDLNTFTDSDTTDDLPEGSTNLYYTDARVQTHLGAVTGNIIPDTDSAYDLGSSSNKFKDLYLSGQSIYLGNIVLNEHNNQLAVHTSTDSAPIARKFDLSNNTTDDLPVGSTNLYYDSDRTIRTALDAIRVSGGALSYNASSGTITYSEVAYQGFDSDFNAKSTTDLSEGSNLYFTNARAREAVNFEDNGGFGSFSYDTGTGIFSYTGVSTAEIRNQFSGGTGINISGGSISTTITQYTDADARGTVSVTDAGGDGSLSYDSGTGIFTYTGPSASEVRSHFSAGTGIGITNGQISTSITQYTDADARASVSATDAGGDGSFSYDSGTGVFTYTGPSASEVRAHFSEGAGISITNGEIQSTITQYTDADARATVSVNDAGGDGSLSYDSGTGIFTYTGPSASEVRAHISAGGDLSYNSGTGVVSFTERTDQEVRNIFSASGDLNYDSSTGQFSFTQDATYTATQFDSDLGTKTTDDLTEGSTNLYYDSATTRTNARNAISVTNASGDGSLAYSASTGTITYTGPSASETRAHFSGGTGVTITDGSIAIAQSVGTTDDIVFGKVTVDSAEIGCLHLTKQETAPNSLAGLLYYDSDPQKGLSFIPTTNELVEDVTINLGQEHLIYVHNLTGEQIDNGDAVYVSGTAHGVHPQVTKARANASNPSQVTGIATMDIPNGNHGYITQFGLVNGLNTSGMTEGAFAYLSADSAGKWSTTEVSIDQGYPTHVGRVISVDSTSGSLLVNVEKEHAEYLRVEDRVIIDGKITADSGDFKLLNVDVSSYSDIDVPNNLPAFREGNLFYMQGPDALVYSNSSINVKVGQDEIMRVFNNSGSSIPKGKVVYVTGAANDFPTIDLAKSDNFSTTYTTTGLTSSTIANGTYGYVTVRGLYGGLNTASFNVGDLLHVSPDSAGEMVAFSPDYPNWPYQVGTVLVADSATGGNVGGCIQISLSPEIAENIRVQGNQRVDGDVTIAGNLNILGSETTTTVQSLNVGDQFIYVGAGDTIETVFGAGLSGLNDATFKEYYEGDSDRTYFVKITGTDSAGDTIQWGFDSAAGIGEFTPLSFDSDGGVGPTSWNLGDDRTLIPLRYNVKVTFSSPTGHTLNNYWKGDAQPINQDFGLVGNYNTVDAPYTHAGVFRDTTDSRWKFFNKYDPEVGGNVNTSDPSFELADLQVNRVYGDVTGAVTGNASTANSLLTSRTIGISGDVTGTATSFDGTSDITITAGITANTIVNADINANADIADTKLATISTAGKVQNSATTATSVNTASTIVARDGSGNFTAGTITADLVGDVTGTVSSLSNQTSTIRGLFSVDNTLSYDSATGQFSITNPGTDSAGTHAIFSVDSSANTGDGSLTYNNAGVFTYVGPSAAETRAHFSAGTGITLTNGQIATTITQYADADARGSISLSADNGISTLAYNSGTGQFTFHGVDSGDIRTVFSGGTGIGIDSVGVISTSITQYVDANARSAISRTNTGTGYGSIDYNSSTGVINYNRVTDANIRGAFSEGTGISITNGEIATTITQYTDADAQSAVSGGNTGTGFGSLAYNSASGAFTFTKVTKANVLSSLQAGTGITLDSANGTIATTITQYADADARSAISHTNTGTGFGSIGYNSGSGTINYNKVTKANIRSALQVSGDLSFDSSNGMLSFSETYSTAAELLTALKTVDTNSSGLNADTLDGEQGSHYRINVYNSSGTLLN